MNLIADAIYNLAEGLIIGASYLAGVEIWLPITRAAMFHEIPHELGNFFALLYARFPKTRALGFRLLSETAVISRIVLTLFIGSRVKPLE
jgi:zinc transporter ZupT